MNIFELKLPYSLPFRNTSLPNEGHFANFAQNWLSWQRPLQNWKKRGPYQLSTNKYLSFGQRLQKMV